MSRRVEMLMWLGVWGAPVAWAISHVAGWGATEADCGAVGGVSFDTWVTVLTVAAAVLAATGIAASVLTWRAVSSVGQDDPPPAGRTRLMAVCGMVISPLMLVLIVLTGTGALLLGTGCAQAQPPNGVTRPDNERSLSDTQLGGQLFAGNCSTCHGIAGDGLRGRGPSLRGVGARAADFYLSTGYMPLGDPHEQPWRSRVPFTKRELRSLVGFVASLGGGPPVPHPAPASGNVAEGLHLFTEHCAGCHQVVGEGGYATDARVPRLKQATATQIAEAVRIGPYLMPRFSRKAISDRQLNSIVAYIQASRAPADRGGWGIGHIGPVPEGMVTWFIAAALLLGLCGLIGERLRT